MKVTPAFCTILMGLRRSISSECRGAGRVRRAGPPLSSPVVAGRALRRPAAKAGSRPHEILHIGANRRSRDTFVGIRHTHPQSGQIWQVEMPTIDHIKSARLWQQLVEDIHVMHFAICDTDEYGDVVPCRSINVCIFTAPLRSRKRAQAYIARPRSMVVESRA